MVHRAVLLGAGRGTRLVPLTDQTPKCLLPIAGQGLIDRQLSAFAAVGIDDVTLVAGFMADAVARHVAGRCRVIVNEHYATTGSIASLALAAPHLRGQGFLLQNADTLYSVDLLQRLQRAPHENVCLVDAVRPYRPEEYHVEVADGRVCRYSNLLPQSRSIGESAQLLRVGDRDSSAFLHRIEELISLRGPEGFPNLAYDALMNGQGLWPVFTAGLPWWEIDSEADFVRCNAEHALISQAAAPAGSTSASGTNPPKAGVTDLVKSIRWRRFCWLSHTIRPTVRHPIRVTREVKEYLAGGLSPHALDLAVNGQDFLRLVYAEAGKLGFRPFLLWGTLLGCIREGGFIKGDQDIDLGVMAADAHRLPDLRDRLARRGFRIRVENDCKLSVVHQHHPRLYLDIDVVRPHRDGWAITNEHAEPFKRFLYHFPKSVFAATRSAPFLQTLTAQVPQDAEGFLAAVYGNWQTRAAKVDFRYGPLNTEVELMSRGRGTTT